MRRAFLGSVALALALTAIAITVLAQASPAPALPSEEGARVRIIHASPDAPPVDVMLDSSETFTDVGFGHVTDYTETNSGTYTITLRAHSDGTAVLTDSVVFTDGDHTLAAAGKLAALDLLKLVDDNSAPEAGMVRGRLVHLSPGGPPVDIAIKDGDVLFTGVGFKEASDYAEMPGGTYELEIRLAGTSLVLGTATLTVRPNNVYTVFAIGNPDNLQFVKILDQAHGYEVCLPIVVRGH